MKKRFTDCTINAEYVDLFSDLSFENVSKVSQMLMDKFNSRDYDIIDVCYGQFRNAAVQEATAVRYLPVQSIAKIEGSAIKNLKLTIYLSRIKKHYWKN